MKVPGVILLALSLAGCEAFATPEQACKSDIENRQVEGRRLFVEEIVPATESYFAFRVPSPTDKAQMSLLDMARKAESDIVLSEVILTSPQATRVIYSQIIAERITGKSAAKFSDADIQRIAPAVRSEIARRYDEAKSDTEVAFQIKLNSFMNDPASAKNVSEVAGGLGLEQQCRYSKSQKCLCGAEAEKVFHG